MSQDTTARDASTGTATEPRINATWQQVEDAITTELLKEFGDPHSDGSFLSEAQARWIAQDALQCLPADDQSGGTGSSGTSPLQNYVQLSLNAFNKRREATQTLRDLHKQIREHKASEIAALHGTFEECGDPSLDPNAQVLPPDFQQWRVALYADWVRTKRAA